MIIGQQCFNHLDRTVKKLSTGLKRYIHSSKDVYLVFDESPHPNIVSTNHYMLDYLHRNLPYKTLGILKEQARHGFVGNVDEVTVAIALKACCRNPKLGCQIHGFATSSGFLHSNVMVANSLMNMYCKSGLFDNALCILKNLSYPDTVSWNTCLSGFEKSNDALNFAVEMNLRGIVFDSVTYTTALSFCSGHKELQFALQLHSHILKRRLECHVFVGNALISTYSRYGHLEMARRVFDEMSNKDFVSWNAMLSGYAQDEYGFEAMQIFIELMRQGIKLDHVSFTGAISACGYERNLEVGRQIHNLAIKTGYGAHVSVCNVLISTYAKCCVIGDAKLVFQSMRDRNVVSWTTIISLSEEDAISLFNQMRLDGVYPNDVTFIGLIYAVTTRNLVEEGRTIHGFCIKTNFLSQLNVCSILITMYAKFDVMQDSRKIFDELNSREIISWNALISGYAQNGLHQEALQIFRSAVMESQPNEYTFGSTLKAIGSAVDISLKHGQRCHCHLIKVGINIAPVISSALLDMYAKRGSICESQSVFNESPQKNEFAWTGIISAHARHGDYDSVMSLFNCMKKEGLRPDSITFIAVLSACCRKGMVDTGRRIFDSMIKDYSIEPSPQHYSCMVDMLGRAGKLNEAAELMDKIPGGPGLSVLQSLLGSCTIHGNMELGEKAADALMEMEPTESGAYVLMSNLYAVKRQWEKVARIRKGMRDKRVRKEVGFSWVDVGDIDGPSNLPGFSSGDKTHPRSEEICWMAQWLGLEMRLLKHCEREYLQI